MNDWMTIEECIALFRKKKAGATMYNVLNAFQKSGVKRKFKLVGKRKTPIKQQYYSADVYKAFEKYNPIQQFTYRRSTPPPEGWHTLKYIADHLGANHKRLMALCSRLAIPAHMYKGKRYARLDECEYQLSWRTLSFMERYRSMAWIDERIQWQKKMGLEPPIHIQQALCCAIYAPELIHI